MQALPANKNCRSLYQIHYLVHLDCRIDNPCEGQAGQVAHSAREDEEREADDTIVTEIEECRGEFDDVKLGVVIISGIEEHPVRGGTGDKEGTPPPVVVL